MAETFAFTGDERVGSYVVGRLEPLGLRRVDDVALADVAFTYCLAGSQLEDAYFDDGGLVKDARPETMLIDLSPSTPSLARELSAVALVNDLVFVEAPLAVVDPAAAGAFSSFDNMVCYLACEDEIPREAAELLGHVAKTVVETGAIGTAQLAKASHTAQMAAQIVAAVEVSALWRSQQSAAHASDALARGDVALGEVSRSVLASIARGDFEEGYALERLMADVVAAMSAADDVDLIMPQLEAAMHLLELMAVIGGADMGPSALALLYREEAEGAEHGLDWTRAEGLYETLSPEMADYSDDDEGFGFQGGFGGYSEN